MSDYRLRIVIRGVFFNEKGEVLLINSADGEFWTLPGGGLEENESLADAAQRELNEETGFSGTADKIIFVQEFISQRYGKQLEVFFSGKIIEGKQENADHESKFFDKESFRSIVFYPKVLKPFVLSGSADYLPRFGKKSDNVLQ